MSSTSSNSPGRDDTRKPSLPAEPPQGEFGPGTLETFEIDVAAGNSTQLDDLGLSSPSATQPVAAKPQTVESTQAIPAGLPEGILVAHDLADRRVGTAELPQPIQLEQQENQTPAATKVASRVARQSSWWITSLGVHIILLVCLAFSTLVIIREEKLELYASAAVYEPVEEFEDLEIDPSEDLDSLDEELSEPDPAPLENLSSESLIEESAFTESTLSEAPSTEVSNSLSELGQLFGETGTGLTGMDSAVGEGTGGGMAKFFGTEIKARRILYMLDNSGGMRKKGKFEALVSELKKSVQALDAKQEFYVIFYSDTVYPLFYPQGVRKFVRSNERNLKLLDRWLDSVELCGGNAIDEALAAAEVIRPEAVFLLTDGDLFTTDKKKALLLNPAGRSYSIHTFGLGVGETTQTAAGLKQVAEANSGTFRVVKVTDEMRAEAVERQRPYHSKEPGPVWGLKVGGR